ncbi:MAG: hypothetical protein A2Y79_05070 [Deltaproteobacteria bacterium RBG_13_43_22]|nr:MAG: hypothetical protein A2Y79_05070 [Deltaproteobacteria bacterium RBG_13_43_22]
MTPKIIFDIFEAPCTKVQGIFQARKGFICCSSLANPRSKLRGMRSLFLFKEIKKELSHEISR